MSTFDEPAECPLCMEPLELDDVNFYPCTCAYQICRFCWHRIRTDENGLCPACRKAYPECPADFKPLSEEQMHRIKNEKRQKDIQRKQKITENRKHLASVRVVQKNLVFVVGLSQRLADTEILKKQEYFGKFGKILKVVINQNTSYAGSQSHGPSASAYVTYQRAEDSLRAIQAVNNVHVDGRTLKASLGTTKYCSHFLRNSQCPKLDCMYLHELGDENASFTKEDMQMGKHQEYEQKLLHDLLGGGSSHSPGSSAANTATHNHTAVTSASTPATTNSTSAASHSASNAATSSGGDRSRSQSNTRKKQPSPPTTQKSNRRGSPSVATESWPSLSKTNGGDETTASHGEESQSTIINSHAAKQSTSDSIDRTHALPPLMPPSTNGLTTDVHENHVRPHNNAAPPIDIPKKRVISETGSLNSTPRDASPQVQSIPELAPPPVTDTRQAPLPVPTGPPPNLPHPGRGAGFQDIAHLFGGNGFIPQANLQRHIPAVPIPGMPPQNEWNNSGWTNNSELLPVDSHTTDWQAAFGFASDPKDKHNEDDLGFDPWQESSQGLADLLEKELQLNQPSKITQPPPGFNNHNQPFAPLHRHGRPVGRSKILPWVHSQSPPTSEAPPSGQRGPAHPPPPANHVPRFPAPPRSAMPVSHSPHSPNPLTDHVHLKTWQDGLRALLPNINISFGQSQQPPPSFAPEMSRVSALQNTGDSWVGSPTGSSWAVQDPAIVSIRSNLPNSAETNNTEGEEKPHWLESLQNLTETDSPTHTPTQQQTNHFFPTDHIHNRPGVSWGNHLPPPGFNPSQIRPLAQNTAEPHTITENL